MSILNQTLLNICLNFKQALPTQSCLLCGTNGLQNSWCDSCNASLPRLSEECCPVCALPTPDSRLCGRCLQHPPQFSRSVAAFSYTFPLNKIIHALKYQEHFHLSKHLAQQLAPRIRVLPDCIVPMPLHPLRLQERGYNQAMLLAQDLGQLLGVPVLPHACQRLRHTASQSGLPWNERTKNMRNAFGCKADLQGRHVAIVDDVMTTGATLDALAATLRKKAGAADVSAWVIARTLPHE